MGERSLYQALELTSLIFLRKSTCTKNPHTDGQEEDGALRAQFIFRAESHSFQDDRDKMVCGQP